MSNLLAIFDVKPDRATIWVIHARIHRERYLTAFQRQHVRKTVESGDFGTVVVVKNKLDVFECRVCFTDGETRVFEFNRTAIGSKRHRSEQRRVGKECQY